MNCEYKFNIGDIVRYTSIDRNGKQYIATIVDIHPNYTNCYDIQLHGKGTVAACERELDLIGYSSNQNTTNSNITSDPRLPKLEDSMTEQYNSNRIENAMSPKEFEKKYPSYNVIKQRSHNRYFICDDNGSIFILMDVELKRYHTYKNITSIEVYDDLKLLFNYFRSELK